MKTERNILIAFLLNLSFSAFEFLGGVFTGSVAIASDAIHDIGDAISIGASYFLEKKSKQQPDETYTYGYARYSVIGSVLTTLILLLGSVMVIYNAIRRFINPTEINYNGMMLFAVIGVCVNLGAAFFTRGEGSFNQKAVNLHMLEDVLGWVIVLVGAIVMRFTGFARMDAIMSIGVAMFILMNAAKTLKEVLYLFLEKVPHGVDVKMLKERLAQLEGVADVHHIHVWSMDGLSHYATMHIVTDYDSHQIKEVIREKLREQGIIHVTLELEKEGECCGEPFCHMGAGVHSRCHHHHQY